MMRLFWREGAMFIRELQAHYSEPRPTVNALSTMLNTLQNKGFVTFDRFGNSYRYRAAVTAEEYSGHTLSSIVGDYFHNSYLSVVSSLVDQEKISVEELRELIDRVEKANK